MDLPLTIEILGAAIAITTGIVQAVKSAGMSSRWAPIVSIVVGVGTTFLFHTGAFSLVYVATGLIVGLSASGLYSGVKTVRG